MSSHQFDAPYRPQEPIDVPPIPERYEPPTTQENRARDAAASVTKPASDVADTAKQAGQDVAQTAKAEVGEVVAEAKYQGRKVWDEGLTEVRSQAASAQDKIADLVQSLSDELRAMAGAQEANGPLAGLASQGQELSERAASWLRDNDPDQALAGVRRYAARNPWTFLAIAAGAGLVAGRLARGLQGAASDDVGPGAGVRRPLGGAEYRPAYGTEQVYDTNPQTGYDMNREARPGSDPYGAGPEVGYGDGPEPGYHPGALRTDPGGRLG